MRILHGSSIGWTLNGPVPTLWRALEERLAAIAAELIARSSRRTLAGRRRVA
jgi:hypothetical protein